ncbi:helix-turn-helix domain-containing protein [Granulicella sp. S190]|uniref:helix-turn-helix domain-containing protein n=1 Tax=Granulicella sp. S190 TaxID=1747226 RepID=UPI00352A7A34
MVSNGAIVRRLQNVGETALYLGVKVDTVYKWSRMGVLSKVKLGGALRFDLKYLIDSLNNTQPKQLTTKETYYVSS